MKWFMSLISQWRDHTERISTLLDVSKSRFGWRQFRLLVVLPSTLALFRMEVSSLPEHHGFENLPFMIALVVVGCFDIWHWASPVAEAIGRMLMLGGAAITFIAKWLIDFGCGRKS